jgi:hypothetical protein
MVLLGLHSGPLETASVNLQMAGGAKGDQVVLAIVAQTASRLDVMDLDSCE